MEVCYLNRSALFIVMLACAFVQSIGSKGSNIDQFNYPRGLTLTPDQIQLVVADTGNHRLLVLDATDGRAVSALTPPAGVMPLPAGVAIVPQTGQVLVTDWKRHQVLLFAGLYSTEVIRTFGYGGEGSGDCQLNYPFSSALVTSADVDPDADPAAGTATAAGAGTDCSLVAIADTHNNRMVLYRLYDASFVRNFGSHGFAPGQFYLPRCIAVVPSSCTPDDHSAWLAVGDQLNRRVQVLTQLGQVVRVLQGSAMNGLYPLSDFTCGLTVCLGADGQAEILVADTWNHRVVAFALDGSAARVVCGTGEAGSGAGEFIFPAGLAVTATGDLWVVDTGNNRLCLFK
jgi:DNA-binding beta-propeller fold protein YncE